MSKKSFFNRGIYLNDLKRFWPIGLAYFIIIFFEIPFRQMTLFYELENGVKNLGYIAVDADYYKRMAGTLLADANADNLMMLFILVMATILFVFGYINKSRSAYMIHAFPVTRTELFISHITSVYTLLLVPEIVCMLTSFIVLKVNDSPYAYVPFMWLLCGFAFMTLFIGVGALSIMAAGQAWVACAVYALLNTLYGLCYILIEVVRDTICFGRGSSLSDEYVRFINPILNTLGWGDFGLVRAYEGTREATFEGGITTVYGDATDITKVYIPDRELKFIILYIVVGLLIIGFAALAYNKRRMETAGDFLCFNWTKPVFKCIASFVGAIVISVIILTISGRDYYSGGGSNKVFASFMVAMAISGIIIFHVAQMFISKSFRVFSVKLLKESLIFTAVILVLLTGIHFEIFGTRLYVPDENKIASCGFCVDGQYYGADEGNLAKVEKIMAVQQKINDNRFELMNNGSFDRGSSSYMDIDFRYNMKDGSVLTRHYILVLKYNFDNFYGYDFDASGIAGEIGKEFEALLDEVRSSGGGLDFYMNCNIVDYDPVYMELYLDRSDEKGNYSIYMDKNQMAEMETVKEAIIKDIEAGNLTEKDYDGLSESGEFRDSLNMTMIPKKDMKSDVVYYYGDDIEKGAYNRYVPVNFNENCTNLIEALIETGFIESKEVLSSF